MRALTRMTFTLALLVHASTALAGPIFSAETQVACSRCREDSIRLLTREVGHPPDFPMHLRDEREGTFRLQTVPDTGTVGGRVRGTSEVIVAEGLFGLFTDADLIAEAIRFGIGDGTILTRAAGSMTFDDFVFPGPPGTVPGTRVPGVLKLDLTGFLAVQPRLLAAVSGAITASSRLDLSVRVQSQRRDGALVRQITDNVKSPPPRLFAQNAGFFEENILQPDEDLLEGSVEDFLAGLAPLRLVLPFTVPANTPVTVEIGGSSLSVVSSRAGGPYVGDGEAFFNLINTVSFPTSGPVFELPEGFTVHSTQARIADNRWLGAEVPPLIPVAPVPAPAALMLVAIGVVVARLTRPRHRVAGNVSGTGILDGPHPTGTPLLALLFIGTTLGMPAAAAADAIPAIRIVEPADGAVVTSPVTVRVEVSNFTLQRQGSGKRPNAGHIHYWIDDRTNAMTYPATTETSVKLLLPPGRHKIRAELVLDDHTSLADGHRDQRIQMLPADPAFEHRSSIATVSVDVQ